MRAAISLLLVPSLFAWGVRGHALINRVAIEQLPADGPVFLKKHIDYIAWRSITPDTWRLASEPFLKIEEDPNHGWFREQFAFLKTIPRSRFEFVLALYDEHRRLSPANPEAARLTNVRWTGTLPYAAVETYERIKTTLRMLRAEQDPGRRAFLEQDVAFYCGWLGHYTGDGAQPLHVTIHHDGWQGENPKNYTRDPRIHGRFESAFVDRIEAKPEDIRGLTGDPRRLADPFQAILDHLELSFRSVEDVYRLDLEKAFDDPAHLEARRLAFERLAAGSRLLRDLIYTAWLESAQAPQFSRDRRNDPLNFANPRFNPATGSAPAHRP